MRDWRKIMEDFGLYEVDAHMKTEHLYTFPNGSYMEFFSVDNALKVRGPGRDILFVNESNLIEYDTLRQLLLRTKTCAIIDYNPADEFHWIYDKIIPRKDAYFIKTTYKDNPFLPDDQIKEIESYRDTDENFWRIYGEGERGHSEGIIYTHWDTYHSIIGGNVCYGLDFGYGNPTALVKVTEKDKEVYAEEVIYQSHLTNSELIPLIKQVVPRSATIYCDSEDPNRIRELQMAGIVAKMANKDVKNGILFLKSRKFHIHAGSANLLKEIKSYKFQGKENKDLVPVKTNDHAMDAIRYATTGLRVEQRQSSPMFIK
jgi:phage terminase large subunit